MPENTISSKIVLTVIVKDGKFLLIRRNVPGVNEPRWAFPGGVIHQGEKEEHAVARQAKDEVGLNVEVHEKLLERVHPDTSVRVVYFYCVPKDDSAPKIGQPEEITKVEWVPAKEVLNKFTSDVDPKIQKFILSRAK